MQRCSTSLDHLKGADLMRWFNLVGFGMLTFGIFLDEWVYLYVWERFNIVLVVAVAIYMVVAVGLSLWGSPRPNRE